MSRNSIFTNQIGIKVKINAPHVDGGKIGKVTDCKMYNGNFYYAVRFPDLSVKVYQGSLIQVAI